MVENTLWAVERQEVKCIPIGNGSGPDKIIWHYALHGEYTVKSSYFSSEQGDKSDSNGLRCGLSPGLRKLWRLLLSNKIKIQLWHPLFDDFLVRTNLIRRGIDVESLCPRCNSCLEDILHTFWSCIHARCVWKMSLLWPDIKGFGRGSFCDLFYFIVE